VPLARILCIAAILVHDIALAVRLSHVGTSTADGIGYFSFHHIPVISIRVTILGTPQHSFHGTNQSKEKT